LQWSLPANTQHSQQTDIHDLGGIRTRSPSKQAAAYIFCIYIYIYFYVYISSLGLYFIYIYIYIYYIEASLRSRTDVSLVCRMYVHGTTFHRYQWPLGLRRGSVVAYLLGLRVRIPPRAWISVCCECCVWAVTELCKEPMLGSEESIEDVCLCVYVCVRGPLLSAVKCNNNPLQYIEQVEKIRLIRKKRISYLLTYLRTPWCRVLLEKLTGVQLVKKFSAFHGTRRFITALTSVRHLSQILGQPNPVHIPTSHLLEIHSNIIHPSTLRSLQWSLSFRFTHQDLIQ